MTDLSSSPAPTPRPRLRSILFGWPGKILLVLVLLVVGGYYFENWRGARALQSEKDLMREKGIAVDWRDLLRGPVPDAENFGSVPVLKGLASASGDSPPQVPGLESLQWDAIRFSLPGTPEAWQALRQKLPDSKFFTPPSIETNDVRAVFIALDKMEPVLAELESAATRPVAMFTPSPRERYAAATGSVLIWPGSSPPLQGITRLLEIRASAALELNEAGEALRMIRILRRMYEAAQQLDNGHPANPFITALIGEGLRRHLWNEAQLDELLRLLSISDYSAAITGIYLRFMLQDYDGTFADWTSAFPAMSGNWWHFRATPAGWKDLGRAEILRVTRERLILPVREHGLAALVNGKGGVRKTDHSSMNIWPASVIVEFSKEIRLPILVGEMNRRLLILSLAAERHRLKTGQFPQKIQDILTALPPDQQSDLDGQPLRMEVRKNSKILSFYSVGENMRDDGNAPFDPRASAVSGLPPDDWCLDLPPPL